MNEHRVVVSGIGIISAAGAGAEQCWRSIREGVSSVRPFTRLPEAGPGAAAAIESLDVRALTSSKLKKYMDRGAALAFAAASECLRDARLAEADRKPLDLVIGSCGCAIEWGEKQFRKVAEGSITDLHPHACVIAYPGNVVGIVTILLNLHGRGIVISDLDTSGVDALAYGYRMIRSGLSPRVLVGATEAPLTPVVLLALEGEGLLARCNRSAAEMSRPFDVERAGIVLGEGSVMLLLEDYEAARARGAKAYSEIKSVCSVSHNGVTKGNTAGTPSVDAIAQVLDEAQIGPDALSHVNASACSLREFDRAEAIVIREALNGCSNRVPVSSIKGVTGELLSVSGLYQAATCALSLRDGTLPPSANLEAADPDLDLNFIRGAAREAHPRYVLQTTGSLLQPKTAAVVQAAI